MIPRLVSLTGLHAHHVGLAALAQLSVRLPFHPLESVILCHPNIYGERWVERIYYIKLQTT